MSRIIINNAVKVDYDLSIGTAFGGFYAGATGTKTNTRVLYYSSIEMLIKAAC